MSKQDTPPTFFFRLLMSGAARAPKSGSSVADFFSSETAVGCAVTSANKSYHVAIVGATGAVGEELLRVLERRAFPVERLLPLCSERSAGAAVSFRGEKITAQRLSPDSLDRKSVV